MFSDSAFYVWALEGYTESKIRRDSTTVHPAQNTKRKSESRNNGSFPPDDSKSNLTEMLKVRKYT